MGLAIAARAVALHNGVIEARNRQNGGLVVSVVLPAGVDVYRGVAPVRESPSAAAPAGTARPAPT